MPLRPLSRQQTWLLPATLDEFISDDHPARFVASFVDSLDSAFWDKLKIVIEGDPLGAPAYHPRALLCVWLYGFMIGVRSSRKLEGACRDQMSFLWLTGWQRPDHNTLWRFYKAHRNEMRHLFKLTVKTAVKMNLVDLAVQAVDGSKIAGNATKERTYDAKGLAKLLERTDKVIQELEKENESRNDAPPAHLPEKLRRAEELKAEVKNAIEALTEEERKRINLTDADTELMKSRQGYVAGYNLEAVVSPLNKKETGKTGFIMTAVDVVTNASDAGQLIPMLEQSEENTGKRADNSLADGGFHSGENLTACEERKQVVVMPEVQDKALQKPYHKDKFIYDEATDSYRCPQGQTLKYASSQKHRHTMMRLYRGSGAVCRECPAWGSCTKNKHHGRVLMIGEHEGALRRHRVWMATAEAKELYKKRKELIEPSFGIIKEVMGIRRFLLRGLKNVQAEAAVLGMAFNLRTLFGLWKVWATEKRNKILITLRNQREIPANNSEIPSLFPKRWLMIA